MPSDREQKRRDFDKAVAVLGYLALTQTPKGRKKRALLGKLALACLIEESGKRFWTQEDALHLLSDGGFPLTQEELDSAERDDVLVSDGNGYRITNNGFSTIRTRRKRKRSGSDVQCRLNYGRARIMRARDYPTLSVVSSPASLSRFQEAGRRSAS